MATAAPVYLFEVGTPLLQLMALVISVTRPRLSGAAGQGLIRRLVKLHGSTHSMTGWQCATGGATRRCGSCFCWVP